jgi:outer membrane translocation and assembly module TamA
LNRWQNYLNVQSYLGGESLLRGYPSRLFVGKDMVTTNLEYRSPPLDLSAVQVGAAAFYDVGDAFNGFDHFEPKHGVGLGLRVVFPQVERAVLRADVGFPLDRPSDPSTGQPIAPVAFFVTFHQALTLPAVGAGLGP